MKLQRYKYMLTGLGVNFLMILVFWGGMLRKSFNADTIFHMVVDDADIVTNIEAGRYVISLCDFILFKMGIRTTTNLSVTMLITFILFAVAMTELDKLFFKWKPDVWQEAIGFYCAVNLVFLNVMFAECLMFSEYCVYYGLAYLTAVLGVRHFTERKFFRSIFFMGIAACTYQYAVIFGAVLIVFWVGIDGGFKFSRDTIKSEFIGITLCVGIGVINLASVKLLEKMNVIKSFGKYMGSGEIKEKIEGVFLSFRELNYSGGGILPNLWIPMIFSLVVGGIIFYECITNKKWFKFLFILIIWAGSNMLLYIIPLMQETFSFPPRMSFCFFLIQGMTVVTAYIVAVGKSRIILALASVAYLVVHLLFADFTVTNHFVSNTLDKVYVNMMYQEILKYEKREGIKVKRLAVAKDSYAPNNYEEVAYSTYQINERTLGAVTNSMVEVETGRHFEIIPMDQRIYNCYFQDKDWDYFDLSEQLIIYGDTAYWCIF